MEPKQHSIKIYISILFLILVSVPNVFSQDGQPTDTILGNPNKFSFVSFPRENFFHLYGNILYDQQYEILYVHHNDKVNIVDKDKKHSELIIPDVEKIITIALGKEKGHLYLFSQNSDNSYYVYKIDTTSNLIVDKFQYQVPQVDRQVENALTGMTFVGNHLIFHWVYKSGFDSRSGIEVFNTITGNIETSLGFHLTDASSLYAYPLEIFGFGNSFYILVERELRKFDVVLDENNPSTIVDIDFQNSINTSHQFGFLNSRDESKIISHQGSTLHIYDAESLVLEKTIAAGATISFASLSYDNKYIVAITGLVNNKTEMISVEDNAIEVLDIREGNQEDLDNDGFTNHENEYAWLSSTNSIIGYSKNIQYDLTKGWLDAHLYQVYEKFVPTEYVYLPIALHDLCSSPNVDDFSDFSSGWHEGRSGLSGTIWAYKNSNDYSIFMPNDDWWALSSSQDFWESNNQVSLNGAIDSGSNQFSLDGRVVKGQGYWGLAYGLNWSPDGTINSLRTFEINPEIKQWQLVDFTQSNFSGGFVNHQGYSDVIRPYPATNRLTLERENDNYLFKINGETIFTEIDFAVISANSPFEGNIGGFARSISTNTEIRLDNYYFAGSGCEKEDLSSLGN